MERRGDGGCRSNDTLQRKAGWTGSWCGIADAWSIKILGSCLSGERIGKTVARTEAKKAEGEEGEGKRARGGGTAAWCRLGFTSRMKYRSLTIRSLNCSVHDEQMRHQGEFGIHARRVGIVILELELCCTSNEY